MTAPIWVPLALQLVTNVTLYEHTKLWILNGTHSSLAYLGYQAGLGTIADCMANAVIRRFVRHLWQVEILQSLTPPKGEDLAAYSNALFQRYATPTIRHRTWQIAMDGSQKLPQRILDTLAENLAAHLRRLSDGAEGDAAKVAALLSVREIFPAGLAAALQSDLTRAYGNLRQHGAKSAMQEVLE